MTCVTSLRDSHASHEGDGPLPGLGAPGVQLALDTVGREDRHQARHRGRRQQEQHLQYVILTLFFIAIHSSKSVLM